jgi:gluconate 2-dehydrogenase gamma chain
MADDTPHVISRRDVLKRVGIAGAATAVPIDALAQATSTRGPLETLTQAEAKTLDAIVARLIPTDASGPGATEAHAARYIDRALGGFLAPARETYRAGLAGIEDYARRSKGAAFTELTPQNQDAVLGEMERSAAAGFTGAAGFFNLVLAHTMQGTFCDPYYGGNANFVGWDLLGYPGIRLTATADDQRLDAKSAPTHMSAYDFTMFSKKRPARAEGSPAVPAGSREVGHHGG